MKPPVSIPFHCAALSVAKHDYVARGVIGHPRYQLAVVADDPQVPDWIHERNQLFADAQGVPYVPDVERALHDYRVDVAIVSSEAERHCDLSVRAARAGVHVIQDKPMSTCRSECDRLVEVIEQTGVRFLMWNRNGLPAIQHAYRVVSEGRLGRLTAVHTDFYFAKDAGPPKGTRQPGYPPINWLAHQIASHCDGSDGGLGREPMGELAVEGIYPLGYIRLLCNADVKRVYACATSHFHQVHADNGVEDLASVTLELEDGLLASMAIGRIGLASHPSGGEIKLHLLGTEGAAVFHEARPDVGVYYRHQPGREARQRRVASENDFLLAADFARSIETGRDTVMGVRASQRIYATFEAALRSAQTGQPVDVAVD